MKYNILLVLTFIGMTALGQQTDSTFLADLLKKNPDKFQHILDKPHKNEVQILYTQIHRDRDNIPHFKSFSYRLNPEWYFYPASTVKLPTAIIALEKLRDLNLDGLDKNTPLRIDSAFEQQTRVTRDSSSKNGLPSIGHYIKKVLLTSDNDAHNRLFEFVGRAPLNQRLKELGVQHSRIVNRLAIGDKGIYAKHSNPMEFYQGDRVIYRQEAQYDPKDYPLSLQNTVQGHAYMNAQDEIIQEPWSFEGLNVYGLTDQQLILKKLLFPEAFPVAEQFRLSPSDYNFLYYYMSRLPQEVKYPKYDPKAYWPTYSKLIYYGREKDALIEPNIRIFNKYGDSYGYNIDNAYIVDFENHVEFLLSVVIQSNENGVYNDGLYEYETVTYPFLRDLGHVLYQYELERKKEFLPDLHKFQLQQ